ncbi:MAG: DUF6427 family protein [Crocinitomicaceae bacterium]|jgi:hypothetical protein
MVKLFFGNRSFALIFLPFIIGLFGVLNYWFHYHSPEQQILLGLWGVAEGQLHWLYQTGALALIFINSILINNLFNRHDFMEKNNYLASLLYVVIMSFFHSFYFISGASLAQTLLILMFVQVFKMNQNEDGRRAVFNASIFFGLAASLYPVLLIGTPFLFWMIWAVRPFVLREAILAITGFILPLTYVGIYAGLFGIKFVREQLSSSADEGHYYDFVVLSFLVSLLILFSLSDVSSKIGASTIRLKKLFRILLLFIGLSLGIALVEVFVFAKLEGIGVLGFPLMFILPYAFGVKKPRVFAKIIYYFIFFFAVSKFFISFDLIGL